MMERRELLRWMVATAGVRCLSGLSADDLLAMGTEIHRAPGVGQAPGGLSAVERRIVIAAAERIIPATDTPGATDADVVAFVDKMLSGWYAPDERARFLAGLRELDTRSRAAHGRGFAESSEPEQVTLLTRFDDDVAALRRNPAGANPNDHWFATLKFLTVWGYCTSEVGMRQALRSWPRPGRYDGCAPVTTLRRNGA